MYKDSYKISVYGKGYVGEGIYSRKNHLKINNLWRNILQRCYYEPFHKREPKYKGCSVCDEWLNFQNFAKWFDENYYGDDLDLELDKDILVKGNKIYSPETCIFVPKKINMLFVKKEVKIKVYYLREFPKQNSINIILIVIIEVEE